MKCPSSATLVACPPARHRKSSTSSWLSSRAIIAHRGALRGGQRGAPQRGCGQEQRGLAALSRRTSSRSSCAAHLRRALLLPEERQRLCGAALPTLTPPRAGCAITAAGLGVCSLLPAPPLPVGLARGCLTPAGEAAGAQECYRGEGRSSLGSRGHRTLLCPRLDRHTPS